MGGGGTFGEGIRRLFQRRAPPSSKDNDDRVFVRDLRAQLASIPTTQTQPIQHYSQSDHFSLSPLKPIRVRVPTLFPPPSSFMDPHKKVS